LPWSRNRGEKQKGDREGAHGVEGIRGGSEKGEEQGAGGECGGGLRRVGREANIHYNKKTKTPNNPKTHKKHQPPTSTKPPQPPQ